MFSDFLGANAHGSCKPATLSLKVERERDADTQPSGPGARHASAPWHSLPALFPVPSSTGSQHSWVFNVGEALNLEYVNILSFRLSLNLTK